eukprot:gene5704-8991_t
MTSEVTAATERLYFFDTYKFDACAVVQNVVAMTTKGPSQEEDGNEESVKWIITLDKSIFHPQGGGQPSDVGIIKSASDQQVEFKVEHVLIDKEQSGIIQHTGVFASPNRLLMYVTRRNYPSCSTFAPGDNVTLHVDPERRRLHARLHSAGHLLDAAMTLIGRTDLKPSKGYHFPDGNAYVEYIGNIAPEEREDTVIKLNSACTSLVNDDSQVGVVIEQENDSCLPMRTVTIANSSCPCGGTHVKNTSELKGICVTRIKKNKKAVKVYYTLEHEPILTK